MFYATGRWGSRNKTVPAACSAAQEMVSTQEILDFFGGGTRVHWIQKITELCEAFTIWHQYLNTGLKMKLHWSQLNIS